ncbi:unnamed protein product [Cylicostephanus goldi]|uniref:Uncharacterized protein n=1 Tax=Cylicostephanus goldi TaxID=71465 RepID=A0A3P7QZS3_CYLGO|nr:unnamed protein product [Cylicostephanus goldi]
MRDQRDEKMQRIAELQKNNQQLSVQAQELAHQLLQLQSANKETVARKNELEELRKRRDAAKIVVAEAAAQVEATRARTAAQIAEAEKLEYQFDIAYIYVATAYMASFIPVQKQWLPFHQSVLQKTDEYNTERAELLRARDEYREVLGKVAELQTQARAKLTEKAAAAAKLAAEAKAKEEAERELENRRKAAETAANSVQAQAFGEVFSGQAPAATTSPTKAMPSQNSAPVLQQG